jgi:flagellar biosynthesis protein FlhG
MIQERRHATRGDVIAITSGKGGVGKTNVVINLASALARRGFKVGILDADFGLGNIDVMLGLTPEWHLGHVLGGERTLAEIVVEGPLGIRIVPAASGVRALTALTRPQWTRLASTIRDVSADLDFLLIDTAAGISDNVVELVHLADRAIVVTSFDPAAIVDAYAMIKVLTSERPKADVGVVVSTVRDDDEASLVFRQLDMASTKFLNRSLRYYGAIVGDPAVRESVLAQRPVVDHVPQSRASRCFRILASRLVGTSGGGSNLKLVRRAEPTVSTGLVDEASLCA